MSRVGSTTMIRMGVTAGLLLAVGLAFVPHAAARAAGDPASEPALEPAGADTSAARIRAAPVLESPAPFDSAGRVLTITPQLAQRLQLEAPWSVTGDFVEARLYRQSTGGFVLVVQRPGGVLERTLLRPAERDSLARLVGDSIRRIGGVSTSGERADIISVPAGRAFARSQTIAALLVWGPSLATLTGEPSTGSAVYLATVGTTFFVTTSLARRGTITRAQNHLASDGAFRGALMGAGLGYVVSGDEITTEGQALAVLGGSLVTAGLGFAAGRGMTDGEAGGATLGSTFCAALTAGAIGMAGGWDDSEPRAEVGGVVAAGIAGYPLGLRWVRRSDFGISEGDVTAIGTSSLVGVAAAAAILGDEADGRLVAGVLTGGYVLGAVAGSRVFARPYNLTGSQGFQLTLGALAGGLIAIVPPVLAESDDGQVYLGAAAVGAALGMGLTTSLLELERVSGSEHAAGPDAPRAAAAAPHGRVRLIPQNLAFLLARPAGNLPMIRVEF